jgi:hypothetical protein
MGNMREETMQPDATLVRDVALNAGGGANHQGVQITAAYQIAVARYNHRNATNRPAILAEIRSLESRLYVMGRKYR